MNNIASLYNSDYLNITKSKNINVSSTDKKKLFESCKEFEAIFIKQMLNSMKKTIHKEGISKSSTGQDIFEDMLYDEYSKKMSETAGFGLKNIMYKQLLNKI